MTPGAPTLRMALRPIRIALALLLLASLATQVSAQNETTPSPDPSSQLPGPNESVEGGAGNVYGTAILIGTIAIGGLLAYITRRQRPREPPT